jgi:hypothetical protein
MNPETFAEWLRAQGQVVVRTPSSYWHSEGLRVYQAFPFHWLVEPSVSELSDLFTRHGAVALRYCMPPDSSKGCGSHAIVFESKNYNIELLGYRTRKNVRRGLRNCRVEVISFQRLVSEGWEVRHDTLERQGRNLTTTYESWRNRFLSAAGLPGFEAWGALVQKRIVGYIVTFRMHDCVYILEHQSHRDFLDLNINNALTFVVSENASVQPGVKLLFYGLESLDAPPRLSEFKFHMGYAAKPLRQRVVFRPLLRVLANQLSYGIVSRMVRWLPYNRRVSKARGLLRVCLAEKDPLGTT